MKNKETVPFQDQGRDAGAEGRASTQAREDEGAVSCWPIPSTVELSMKDLLASV